MRYYELVWVLCGVFISSMPGAVWAQAQAHCSIQVKPIASEVAASSDPAFEVVVRVRDAERLQLTYGSLAQYFGLYVLGPWGWQQPDPAKIRPENWMHQQVSSGKPVTIVADHPFRIRFKLSDYFATDPKHLKPGHYQLNVKFLLQENSPSQLIPVLYPSPLLTAGMSRTKSVCEKRMTPRWAGKELDTRWRTEATQHPRSQDF